MDRQIRTMLNSIADPIARQDAIEKYAERIAICIHDGLLSEAEAEIVAKREIEERIANERK